MSDGPHAGLAALDAIGDDLPDVHLVPAVRGELLARAGRVAEAQAELDRAIALAPSEAERSPARSPPRRAQGMITSLPR